ncbi:MAG: isoleucine--tRNA ligase [Pseudomonadota bacterium]
MVKEEELVLNFWQAENVFKESVETRSPENSFIFYDGPPFANGLPHYGHLLTGFVKDTVARYQTMLGKRVERRFGWDCHGLPAELGAEKELGISGRIEINKFGIDKFNEQCRSSVMRYSSEWESYVTRQARWVDFNNDYKTMDINFMESVLWAFKQLYDKGLVYQAMRVMPYSWAAETPLSNFETRLDNAYRERADKTVTVTFTLKAKPAKLSQECESYEIMAWTTTPWTLPSNLALAVHPDMDYVCIKKDNKCYILAKFAAKAYENEIGSEIIAVLKGSDLVGLEYKPLLPYFANHPNSFKILSGDFVVEGDGTGIVHMAPGFGEDDQILCEKHNISVVCPVDLQGKFTSEVYDFKGMNIFDANDEIIKKLKILGSWIKTEQYIHNYPHCWRTDTPLIFKAVPSWYVKVTDFKDRMVELNQQINWIPGHIKDGLFGKWLENARDWSISRNRFWGTPIPVWMSDDPKYPRIDVYGSIAELEQDFKVKVTDLHRPFIDSLTRPNPNDPTGKSTMRRVEDVFDCWFESGSMPYGQVHYPFEGQKDFPQADFIVEYSAQTRGWFYTLMVLSTALFDRPPFLNCICHGVILDINGQKLSKRLQNYADPKELFHQYGADSLRFLMQSSPVLKGLELLIDKDGKMVRDALRLSIKPIWNAYNFFTLYANADNLKAELDFSSDHLLDRYIFSKLKHSVNKIKQSMDAYEVAGAYEAIDSFFEVLNNWYIRRNRHRFWKTEKDLDKQQAYNSLYSVLVTMCKAMAPLLPLISERIYMGLVHNDEFKCQNSVHLCFFPNVDELFNEEILCKQMDKVREVCSAALSIRNRENIRTRLPLNKLTIYGKDLEYLNEFADIIHDELNIKSIEVSENLTEHANFKLKINFPILGKRLPEKIKAIITANKQGQWQNLKGQIKIADEDLLQSEAELTLEAKNPKDSQALADNTALCVLDLTISEELEAEGLARDLIRAIQQARKEAELDVSDHINLAIQIDDKVQEMLYNFISLINEQTLSDSEFVSEINSNNYKFIVDKEIEDLKVKIGIK